MWMGASTVWVPWPSPPGPASSSTSTDTTSRTRSVCFLRKWSQFSMHWACNKNLKKVTFLKENTLSNLKNTSAYSSIYVNILLKKTCRPLTDWLTGWLTGWLGGWLVSLLMVSPTSQVSLLIDRYLCNDQNPDPTFNCDLVTWRILNVLFVLRWTSWLTYTCIVTRAVILLFYLWFSELYFELALKNFERQRFILRWPCRWTGTCVMTRTLIPPLTVI